MSEVANKNSFYLKSLEIYHYHSPKRTKRTRDTLIMKCARNYIAAHVRSQLSPACVGITKQTAQEGSSRDIIAFCSLRDCGANSKKWYIVHVEKWKRAACPHTVVHPAGLQTHYWVLMTNSLQSMKRSGAADTRLTD